MIEIKCSKAQYERFLSKCQTGPLINGRCVLGKNEYNCPALVGGKFYSCDECLRKNIRYIKK